MLSTYHRIIDAAIEQGLSVYVVLTHLDSYHKTFEHIINNEETEYIAPCDEDTSVKDIKGSEDDPGEGRLGENMLGELKGIYLQLSQRSVLLFVRLILCLNLLLTCSLSFGGRDVPPDRMFVIENYR